jgi:ABC-2 type transport system permease protein
MHSLKNEIKFFFSGMGMPYEKVSIMVALVVTLFFTVLFGNNFAKDAPVVVIDLDHTRYSREFTDKIDASPYMKVVGVTDMPEDPRQFFYEDKAYAVIVLPRDLEKDLYSGNSPTVGLCRDNTNVALNADIIEAMNEIVGIENATHISSLGSGASITLNTRKLFSPMGSTANTTTQGFLFFFSSMFFTFATIGMVPRLRLMHQWEETLRAGNPFQLLARLIPYMGCLLFALTLGLLVLRYWGDMIIAGNILLFLFYQIILIFDIGMLSLLFGWNAANPGVASSRMILFIPGGFILGGVTSPISHLSDWAIQFSHLFPLTWEYHFTRDILQRGAGFTDLTHITCYFLLYTAAILAFFCLRYAKEKRKLSA